MQPKFSEAKNKLVKVDKVANQHSAGNRAWRNLKNIFKCCEKQIKQIIIIINSFIIVVDF